MGDDDTVVPGVVAGSKFGVYDLVSLRPQSKVGDALIASGFRADMHSGRVISSSSSSTAAPEYVVLVWAHTESKDRLVHSIPEEDLALGFVTTHGTQPTNVSQEVLALSSTCTAVKDMTVARCEKAAQRDLNDYRSRPGGGGSAGAGGASNGAAAGSTAAAAGSTTTAAAAGTAAAGTAAAGSTAAAAAGRNAAAGDDGGGSSKKLQPGKPKTVAYVMFILCAVAAASAASANAGDND